MFLYRNFTDSAGRGLLPGFFIQGLLSHTLAGRAEQLPFQLVQGLLQVGDGLPEIRYGPVQVPDRLGLILCLLLQMPDVCLDVCVWSVRHPSVLPSVVFPLL